MPINAVLNISEEIVVSPATPEPVTLQEAKDYCKIDTTEDDTLIEQLIVSARMTLEKYTGLSFIPKVITAQLQNDCGGIELPCGPTPDAIDVTLVTAIDGTVFNESLVQIVGNNFKYVYGPISGWLQVVYNAGYTTLPTPLKNAILAQVFFNYHNRGERIGAFRGSDVSYTCDAAKQFAKLYKRVNELSL